MVHYCYTRVLWVEISAHFLKADAQKSAMNGRKVPNWDTGLMMEETLILVHSLSNHWGPFLPNHRITNPKRMFWPTVESRRPNRIDQRQLSAQVGWISLLANISVGHTLINTDVNKWVLRRMARYQCGLEQEWTIVTGPKRKKVFSTQHLVKVEKAFLLKIGSGGRIWTYDLRVMSPFIALRDTIVLRWTQWKQGFVGSWNVLDLVPTSTSLRWNCDGRVCE